VLRLLLFFVSISYLLPAQRLDSLAQLLSATEQPEKRVDILNEFGYQNWIHDPQRSVELGKEALELAQSINYTRGTALAHRIMGVGYWALGAPKLALENLTAGRDLYTELDQREGIANCILNIGMVYADIGELDRAQSLYLRAINEFESLNLESRIGTAFTKLGMVYLERDRLEEARNYFTDALRIHTDDGFDYGISEAHNRLGQLNLKMEELEQAEYHILQSMEAGARVDDVDGLTSNHILLGRLKWLQGDPEAAQGHLQKAIQLALGNGQNNYRLQGFQVPIRRYFIMTAMLH